MEVRVASVRECLSDEEAPDRNTINLCAEMENAVRRSKQPKVNEKPRRFSLSEVTLLGHHIVWQRGSECQQIRAQRHHRGAMSV